MLLAGTALDAGRFFKGDIRPRPRGSSFDLTIGKIFDDAGKAVEGPFVLKPGHMVQVVSAEEFQLHPSVTGHVTYKTGMTKRGIWALTVGIVDPGWQGPIQTTLLNYSRVDCALSEGEAFLRVSFFEHEAIADPALLPKPVSREMYEREVQSLAASHFPKTFLDQEEIAKAAGESVLDKIRSQAVIWVSSIALIFVVAAMANQAIQSGIFRGTFTTSAEELRATRVKVHDLEVRLSRMDERLRSFEARPTANKVQ